MNTFELDYLEFYSNQKRHRISSKSPKENISYVTLESGTEYAYISDLNTRLRVG